MTIQKVVIIGGKGTAVNIAEQIEQARQRYHHPMAVHGFAIDDKSLGGEIVGLPVVCGVREAWATFRHSSIGFIFALYRPDSMRQRVELLNSLGIPADRFVNFVHPTAYVSRSATLGAGNVIMSHACLQHGVSLGNCNIVNSHVVIEHEAQVADSAFFAAHACVGARVRIGTGVFSGLNATVREDVEVGEYSIVGMSAAVIKPVDAASVVYGVPAEPKG